MGQGGCDDGSVPLLLMVQLVSLHLFAKLPNQASSIRRKQFCIAHLQAIEGLIVHLATVLYS